MNCICKTRVFFFSQRISQLIFQNNFIEYNKMTCQLPSDCLGEIFEHLEDKTDLHSCLLVSRLWCEVSIPIFWTSIQNYNTLITCLPSESKEILYQNEIITSTSISKPPLFNYTAFV